MPSYRPRTTPKHSPLGIMREILHFPRTNPTGGQSANVSIRNGIFLFWVLFSGGGFFPKGFCDEN